MYYALHLNDGKLVGITNIEPIALPGVSIKELQTLPDLAKSSWNEETLEFDRTSTVYTKLEFMTRFTIAERLSAKGSNDPIVSDFLELLSIAEHIDISDTNTIAGVNYLAYLGIITQQRATEVLT